MQHENQHTENELKGWIFEEKVKGVGYYDSGTKDKACEGIETKETKNETVLNKTRYKWNITRY